MSLNVQCPQPVKPAKCPLDLLDLDLDSSDPEDRPTNHNQPLPTPSASAARTLKRHLECDDSGPIPPKKRCLVQSPPPLTSSVEQWLLGIPARPNTAPLLTTSVRPEIRRPNTAPPPSPAFDIPEYIMSQPRMRPNSVDSTANTRPSVSDPLYRETIHRNHITLDPTGRLISDEEDIQKLLATYILKRRGSPPLTDEEVNEVMDKAADLLDNAEGIASDLIETKAFPLKRPGIAEGRNVQWSTDPLPTNPKYPHQLTAPKPDRHYGFPLGRKFDWTDEQMAVIDHRTAQPYTQPTRDNVFPFLALEVKSEATGGVLYVAENQGVGSGAHIVASQRWLLRQAYPSKVLAATDAVAFVGAVSPRTCVFYVVWYSGKKARFIMSKIRIVSFMEGPDIQRCRDLMKNILEYASGDRLSAIKKALAQMYPVPAHWKKSRPASAVTETPKTGASVVEEDETSSKKTRKTTKSAINLGT